MEEAMHLYAVAVGSNRRHGRYGRPVDVVAAAIARLDQQFSLFDASAILVNKAMGGAGRDFANAVALVESPHDPPTMLAMLKGIEREFGRRPGRRWGERVLDLDLAAWSGGRWTSRTLTIPHRHLPVRDFVIDPLASIAPRWRVADGRTARQLAARRRNQKSLTRP